MKKALMIIALVCLVASSAFAVSITDWTTYNEESGLREYLSDLNPAGFVIDYPMPEETVIGYDMYRVDVISRNVSGWVYDQNESVPVRVTGFDNMEGRHMQPEEIVPIIDDEPGQKSLITYLLFDEGQLIYNTPFDGDGVYYLNPADVLWGNASAYDGQTVVSVNTEIGGDYVWFVVPGTKGSVQYFPEDETEVPEPAAIAYALMGLGSAFGLKRRVKK
ncbi:MAG: hypothetical protein J6X38_05550 [Abditibacteriota bacterium]|nr:hypothetical protein [Abditibacteriota bacterium]